MTDFKLPDLGENIDSGDVVSVLVNEGDVDQPQQDVIEIETDKAVIAVPCPTGGKVTKIHVARPNGEAGASDSVAEAAGGGEIAAAAKACRRLRQSHRRKRRRRRPRPPKLLPAKPVPPPEPKPAPAKRDCSAPRKSATRRQSAAAPPTAGNSAR